MLPLALPFDKLRVDLLVWDHPALGAWEEAVLPAVLQAPLSPVQVDLQPHLPLRVVMQKIDVLHVATKHTGLTDFVL